MNGPIVIVGGGHAGAQCCVALAEAGWGARVHLVCEEHQLPYQRPPLSKSALKNADEPLQWHRPAAWYSAQGISLYLGDPVMGIDRSTRRVQLRSGHSLPYAQLVLATGTRARLMPGWPPQLHNVAVVRSAADAARLRPLLAQAARVTVVGGGFIGLEVAAVARALGRAVQVLEVAPQLLGRSVSPALAEHVLHVHRASGIDLQLGVRLGAPQIEGARLLTLEVNGRREPIELLVLGIGVLPETGLAQQCGLPCNDGILVDAQLRSADPAVLAVGDVARFPAHALAPSPTGTLRLESVQNANDQARSAAATLQGQNKAYGALPWFWSEQGALRLQMAGLLPAGAVAFRRAGASEHSFSWLHYVGERLRCVQSVNAPADHLAARKIIEKGGQLHPTLACDASVPLKAHT